jgi:pentatricopeptide repeat protein
MTSSPTLLPHGNNPERQPADGGQRQQSPSFSSVISPAPVNGIRIEGRSKSASAATSSSQQNNQPVPSSSTSRRGNNASSSTPTPSKLRRKVSVESNVENVASVQRLVEYFVVVGCQPCWEVSSKPSSATHSATTEIKNEKHKHTVSTPIPTTALDDLTPAPVAPFTESRKKLAQSLKFLRRKEASGSVNAINATSTHDYGELESREEIIPPPKPRGMWTRDNGEGSEENIRMPTAEGHEHTFQPKITARYPPTDYADNALNPMVTHFCFPSGDRIVPSNEYSMPRVHHFVLTNEKGRKVYGTCLTIFEEYHPPPDAPWRMNTVHSDSGGDDIEVTVDAQNRTLYIPRVLCILSIWPYLAAFRKYLAQIYRLATSTNVMTAPIERYIMNLCVEIPAPPPGAFEVQVKILDSVIRFWAPPAKLPIAYVALHYRTLFDCLDIDNIMHLWYCLIMERKVLLLSNQYSLLTVCAEILCSLLFPMQWSHLYVPLLPRFLSQILGAPVPYLCGVTRENWLHVQQFVSEETIVVDLDRNSVMFGQGTPEMPPLPGKKWTKLKTSLEGQGGHLFWKVRGLESEYRQFVNNKLSHRAFKKIGRQKGDPRWKEKLETFDNAFNLQFAPDSDNLLNDEDLERRQSQWDRLQECFLRFFVAMFKDYRGFLEMPDVGTPASPTPGAQDWLKWSNRRSFNRDGFLASQKPEYRPFLSEVCMTQQFDDFITKRLYNPELPDVIFFDQSIDAKLNRSRLKLKKVDTPFLQSATTYKILQVFEAVEPNQASLPEDCTTKGTFTYKSWPETFDTRLFCTPRKIPSMITAEFDRQAALVSRLRANHSPGVEMSEELLDFYGGDYDVSPESMAFTVFFFAYSSVIGREWQDYQKRRRDLDLSCPEGDGDSDKQANPEALVRDSSNILQSSVLADLETKSMGSKTGVITDLTLGLCDTCPAGDAAVSSALIYVSDDSPCAYHMKDINAQAYDVLSRLSPLGDLQQQREVSLLDNDEGLAEYEEAREVAAAQLDLAFDTLKAMELREVVGDPDLFKSLMEACGRCGDTSRALELIQMMKRDGLVADGEVLSCFLSSFAHEEVGLSGGTTFKDDFIKGPGRQSDAYSAYLKKKFHEVNGYTTTETSLTGPNSSSDEQSDYTSDSGSDSSVVLSVLPKHSSASIFLEWFTPRKKPLNKRKKRRRKKNSKKSTDLPVTDRLMKQIVLGENLLDFLYPNLVIDTSGDTCPRCSHTMKEIDIVAGWKPCEFQDFTTCCSQCHHRFVPRFSVSCASPTFEGSQGPATPLFCEFLSPWVLRKELDHVVKGAGGIDLVIHPEWRSGTDIRATLWWNLIVLCHSYRLPFSFLLQGSFQNRLINPVPQG